MTSTEDTSFGSVCQRLMDATLPLDARIRALYILKDKYRTAEGVQALISAVDTTDSVLLQHEFLYNVGQFGFVDSLPALQGIALAADKYSEVSRHEAIEAIGAIGDVQVLEFLAKLKAPESGESAPIVESCELAIERIRRKAAGGPEAVAPPPGCEYSSVDPAPAAPEIDVAVLKSQLLDESLPLWDRYTAMFALRNIGNDAATAALSDALRSDKSSCLFRHEVAFVLGQMEKPLSAEALAAAVRDTTEHPMVRHEAAEALGALADPRSHALLEEYAADPAPIVRDSCVVALEMHKYWSSWKPAATDASAVSC